MDKRIRAAGCFAVTHRGGLYFYPKLPQEIYRMLNEDIELRLELKLFLLKQTAGPTNGS